MDRTNANQKKRIIMNYVYATIIGLLVIVCAVVIGVVNANNSSSKIPTIVNPEVEVGGNVNNNNQNQDIVVSAPTFVVPMKGATVAKDYSAKELQYNETLKQWEIHKAIDFVAGENLNVFAITDGKISNVYTNYLEGTVVEITHDNGLVTVYKSLETAKVKVGDKVIAGQTIGVAGQTMAQEQTASAHLHLEVLKNGVKVDPNNYIDLGAK